MGSAMKMFIRAREIMARRFHGQTMVEYALIIASIGVVAWAPTTSWGMTSVRWRAASIPI